MLKVDLGGNILDSISYGFDNVQYPGKLEKTRDGKILVCATKYGSINYDIYALKLKQNLQLDTMYNISLNYDSLCSTGITTGTITLDTMSYVGIPDVKAGQEEFLVFPNPSGNYITVSGQQLPGKGFVTIYNLLGEKIFQSTIQQINNSTINISSFPDGIYFLQLRDKIQTRTQKFIISR